LHAVADDILNNHDEHYKLCFDPTESDKPEVKCDSTYVVIVEEDITYAEGLSHDGTSSTTFAIPLKLDVYVPDNNSDNRPVYMFIHGGGFSGGTKTQEAIVEQANYFASRGWVFVSIDYRLRGDLGSIFTGIVPQDWFDAASQTNQPGQILAMYAAQRDAKAAMRWIIANAENYNINTDYVTVGGGSAGAITAVTLGVSNQEDFRDEISLTDDPTLATTNLDKTYEIKSIVDYWGSNAALEIHEILYGTHRFVSDNPPLFIAHGTEDSTVLFTEAEILVQLYDSTGVYVDFNPLVGRGHGPWGATVDGKSLSELSFDFLVEQQELILDEDCDQVSSIYENSKINVSIFPNPASTFINIKINNRINFKATLFDLNGRKIDSVINNSQFNTSLLPTGIYILVIKDIDSGMNTVKRIILEK
jgi:acetyl esterase/lipase